MPRKPRVPYERTSPGDLPRPVLIRRYAFCLSMRNPCRPRSAPAAALTAIGADQLAETGAKRLRPSRALRITP